MSNETTSKAKLFAKVAKVMAAVRTLPKDGTNTFDKYNYITGDAAFERIGKEMAANMLVALPSVIECTTVIGESGSGKAMLRTVVRAAITLADGETGETWTSEWYGEGADRGDKSINKAMTAMMKYYLLRLFQVGSGDDADEDSPEVKPAQKTQQQATQKQQAQPQRQPQAQSQQPTHRQQDNTAPAISVPKSFADADAAIKWGYDTKAFEAIQHAKNAYDKLKTEHKPKDAATMFDLWINDVKRRLEEKQQEKA